jgi:hypothetical protein
MDAPAVAKSPPFTNFNFKIPDDIVGNFDEVTAFIARLERRIARAVEHLAKLADGDSLTYAVKAYIADAKAHLEECSGIRREFIAGFDANAISITDSEPESSKPRGLPPKIRGIQAMVQTDPVDVARGACVAALLLSASVLVDVRLSYGGFPKLRVIEGTPTGKDSMPSGRYGIHSVSFEDGPRGDSDSVGNFRVALDGYWVHTNLETLERRARSKKHKLIGKGGVNTNKFLKTISKLVDGSKGTIAPGASASLPRFDPEKWRVDVRQTGSSAGKEFDLSGDTFTVGSHTGIVAVAKEVLTIINGTLSQVEWGVTNLSFFVFMNDTRVVKLDISSSNNNEEEEGRKAERWGKYREISRLVFKDRDLVLQEETNALRAAREKKIGLVTSSVILDGECAWNEDNRMAIADVDGKCMTVIRSNDLRGESLDISTILGKDMKDVLLTSVKLCDQYGHSKLSREVVLSVLNNFRSVE